MEKKNFFAELIERLLSPTPEFHAKLRNLALGVVTIATVAYTLPGSFVPDAYDKYLEFIIAVGGAFGIYAQTTSTKH